MNLVDVYSDNVNDLTSQLKILYLFSNSNQTLFIYLNSVFSSHSRHLLSYRYKKTETKEYIFFLYKVIVREPTGNVGDNYNKNKNKMKVF